ncbi:sterol desaturase family protein [Echinicola shivajiensis]|uniref:sterol desaturase family protein n=1 Tax=Echinicola shivajiensis TaxID=1035916 RepID=UPI001BFC89FA|nr:sterol desaturase family protein [Echinicola shivajiensis]
MVDDLIENVLFEYSYVQLYALSFGYFILLYFGLAPLFLLVCKYFVRKNLLDLIDNRELRPGQLAFEKWHSLKSIIVFGFSIIPVIYFIRMGWIVLLPNTWINILIGLVVLTLWNEIHFFVVHRIMHQRFFMKNIHFVHHKSITPTVYSVYSFHWFEAFLLSTVPITIAPFLPFSILAIFIYPFVSILLNYAGHCNYRFGSGKGDNWWLFGTHHNKHHSKGKKNYGFALNFLDKLFSKPNH